MEDKIKELIREQVKEVIEEVLAEEKEAVLKEEGMFVTIQDLELKAQEQALSLFRSIARALKIKDPDELAPEEKALYRSINEHLKDSFKKTTIETIRALNGFPLRAKKQ